MSKSVKFKFENLNYQDEAVDSIVSLFSDVDKTIDNSVYYGTINAIREKLQGEIVDRRNIQISNGKKLRDNLRKIQSKNGLILNDEVETDNNTLTFTIEMETGTGKTYVYLKTILELYKKYDGKFKKFIIVVPTVPIRMGVEKSVKMLKEHFKKETKKGIDISKHIIIYDSKLKDVAESVRRKFIDSQDLSILVMNTQAFNKDTNILRNTDHEKNTENISVWDEIRQLHPVVIIDEPQKFDGGKNSKKRTSSLSAIDEIQPTFTLRYSATHNEIINPTYKLDSYAAYRDKLVKRIKVKTVNKLVPTDFPYIRYLEFTKDFYAKIEIFHSEKGKEITKKTFKVRQDSNGNIFELSGDLPQYRNFRIAENPFKGKSLKIETKGRLVEINEGDCLSPFSEKENVRIQMKIAIQSHLEQQFNLLESGQNIKALSLFFIDRVSKVRGEDGEDGEYLKIFDSVYNEVISDPTYNKIFEEYPDYFKEYKDTKKVRQGYFAIDKKKGSTIVKEIEGWNEDGNDSSISLKAKDKEYIERGIELILEKKDELISFEEPLAFIFSHSALREGWDNPNVFTLCTLKNSSNSIAKKQEIGRGLRFPVDTEGNRCKDESLNVLTVVANDSYDHFSEKLQQSYDEESGFNKDEVTNDVINIVFKKAGIPIEKITSELTTAFRNELRENGLIDKNDILKKDAEEKFSEIQFKNETLKEHSANIKKEFVNQMKSKGSKKINIENGDLTPVKNKMQSYVKEADFKRLLKGINERLAQKTIYKININKDNFIEDCIKEINNTLYCKEISNIVEHSEGMHYIDENNKAKFEKATEFITEEVVENIQVKSDFEIINYIMAGTELPRMTISKVLKGIKNRKVLNSQDYLDDVMIMIKEIFIRHQVKDKISYELLNGYKFDSKTIFSIDEINATELNDPKIITYKANSLKRKAINEYYKFDNEKELEFAQSLENDPNILLFTKIKKGGFVILTPYGNYSPDWAVVYKNNYGKAEIYFIVETKFDKKEADLSEVEKFKIHCGKEHFKVVSKNSEDYVKFDWANSYEQFKEESSKVKVMQ